MLGAQIVRAPEVDSSYGAALLGLCGLGVYKDINEAQQGADFEETCLNPDEEIQAIYQSVFEIYRKIQQAMQPVYHEWQV